MMFIYSISDPLTGLAYYIGATSCLKRRRKEHLGKKRGLVYQWISSLSKKGLDPEFNIIDTDISCNWRESELFHIKMYAILGHPILNKTNTGERFCKLF